MVTKTPLWMLKFHEWPTLDSLDSLISIVPENESSTSLASVLLTQEVPAGPLFISTHPTSIELEAPWIGILKGSIIPFSLFIASTSNTQLHKNGWDIHIASYMIHQFYQFLLMSACVWYRLLNRNPMRNLANPMSSSVYFVSDRGCIGVSLNLSPIYTTP